MSEESKINSNIAILVAIIATLGLGWFTFGNGASENTNVATTTEVPTEVIQAVATIQNDEIVEEVVVTADPTNLSSDEEESNDELAEKAQEAAIRNQVNEAIKKSEDADITTAEKAE